MANKTPLAEMFSVSAEYAPPGGLHRRCQMQRKSRRTLHVFVVFRIRCVSVIGAVPSAATF